MATDIVVSSITKIQQFDGTNFSNWKYRVGILLDEKGLRKYIEKSLETILTEVDPAKRVEANTEEKKCISILVQSIHDSQLEYVREKTTAKDMYDALVSVFERKSIATQLLLRKELLTMKYNPKDDITNHFLLFDRKIRELKSTGAKMEPLDVVVHLLLTLPKEYDTLVTALETMDQEKLSMDFVKTRLMDEYNKRSGISCPIKPSEPGAMNAKVEGNQEIVCYRCHKPGHKKSQCWLNNKKGKRKNAKNNKGSANKASDANVESMCAIENGQTKTCSDKSTVHSAQAAQRQRSSDSSQIKFVLDSGATQHMVNEKRYFNNMHAIDQIDISVAKKNQCISANQQGDIAVKTLYDGDTSTKKMEDVLFVNDLKCNLMSIRSLTKKGYVVKFEGDTADVSLNGRTKFVANANGKVYETIFHMDADGFAGLSGENKSQKLCQSLWHFRLGHLNTADMKKLVGFSDGMQINVSATANEVCEPCVFGKQTRSSFPRNKMPRSKRILELVHTDVWGPLKTTAYDGSRFFVTFTDDYSRASMVYFMQHKSEVFEKFKEFIAMAEARHGKRLAKLRADNGGEYISNEFKAFCTKNGIELSYTVPDNPEMNPIAERLNRTLEEKARTMLIASGVETKFWNEAVLTANYLKNRSPTSAIGEQFKSKTPAEIWFGQKPALSHLRIFGCECYNHIPARKRSKMDAKSSKCIMLGYTASNGSYRLWDIERNKLVTGRSVIFNEASVLNRSKHVNISISEADPVRLESFDEEMFNGGAETTDLFDDASDVSFNRRQSLNDEDDSDDDAEIHSTASHGVGNNSQLDNGVDLDDTGDITNNVNSANGNSTGNNDRTIPRRSERVRRAPDRYGDWASSCVHMALCAEQFVDDDPITIEEAKHRTDWPEWKKAIESEYGSLLKSNTWTVCELPKGRSAISNKWVFKLKRKADGSVDKYKARLVARGFSQKAGFDYNETYAPVAKLTTLKILLSIANQNDMHIHQMDVKSAFLNGELSEDIYMQLPDGFGQKNMVCKLNKALYGLKQASRAWNEKFNEFMIRIGFKRSQSDQCLYVKHHNGVICFVLLYVDDTLIFCCNLKVMATIKKLFSNEFEMTDMGEASSFLGMQIERDIQKGTITLSQSRYLQKVLHKFGMQECKSKSTPMEKGLHLDLGEKGKCSNHPYRELIGCLTYAAVTTRPDLCASVGYFSRYQSCFNEQHFNHAKNILRYIRGTIDMKLVYTKNHQADTLIGYSDSDWAGDRNDSKSTSGYVFKLHGNTISWASRKQPTVSKSSTEAEYIALAEAISECEWLRKLLVDLMVKFDETVSIYEDNTSCIKIAEEPREYKRMKHLDVKYMFVRDFVQKKKYKLIQISSEDQVADIMTKALGRILFVKHRTNMNLV